MLWFWFVCVYLFLLLIRILACVALPHTSKLRSRWKWELSKRMHNCHECPHIDFAYAQFSIKKIPCAHTREPLRTLTLLVALVLLLTLNLTCILWCIDEYSDWAWITMPSCLFSLVFTLDVSVELMLTQLFRCSSQHATNYNYCLQEYDRSLVCRRVILCFPPYSLSQPHFLSLHIACIPLSVVPLALFSPFIVCFSLSCKPQSLYLASEL